MFGYPGFCLIFILSKNKGFQSGALTKMPTPFPSMEEFSLDIQKFTSYSDLFTTYLEVYNKQRLNFPKITKPY